MKRRFCAIGPLVLVAFATAVAAGVSPMLAVGSPSKRFDFDTDQSERRTTDPGILSGDMKVGVEGSGFGSRGYTGTQDGAPPVAQTSIAAPFSVGAVAGKAYFLGKDRYYSQISEAAPELHPLELYDGVTEVVGFQEGDFTNASLVYPGEGPFGLAWYPEKEIWSRLNKIEAVSQAQLDAAIPDNPVAYGFLFDLPGGGGTLASSLILNGGDYPPPIHVQNYALLQDIDSAVPLTIDWNPVAGATADDFIFLQISSPGASGYYSTPLPGSPGALAGTATTYEVPPNTFIGGGPYYVRLTFIHVVNSATGDVPEATGFAFYSSSNFIIVTAQGAPEITLQPESQTVDEGEDVTFSVVVAGTPAPTLQWYINGQNVPGSTAELPGETGSSLTLDNVTLAEAANYFVVATNSQGSVASQNGSLTVNVVSPPPAPATATSSNTYSGGFSAIWPSVPSATGYVLDVAADAGFTSFVPGFQNLDVGNVLSYNVTGLPPGQYYFRVFAYNGLGTGPASPTGTVTTVASRFLSLSTRGQTGPSDGVLILGFSISTTQPKQLLIRAAGPALQAAPFDILTAIDDSRLVLTQFQGPVIPPGNDDWDDSDTNLMSAMASVFAFGYPAGSADSAYLATLNAGLYTVAAETVTGDAGVTIVELYELDDVGQFDSISTRAFVGAGDFVLIPGVALGGGTSRLLVRAVGRTLGEAPFNVPGVLDDPVLSVLPPNGPQIAGNDDWEEDGPEAAAEIEAISDSVFLFGLPSGSPDAVVLIDLAEGPYTFIVSGKNGATGIVLLELYRVP